MTNERFFQHLVELYRKAFAHASIHRARCRSVSAGLEDLLASFVVSNCPKRFSVFVDHPVRVYPVADHILHGHGLSFKKGGADGSLDSKEHEKTCHGIHAASYRRGSSRHNNSVNSDAQLRCASLGAGYAGR